MSRPLITVSLLALALAACQGQSPAPAAGNPAAATATAVDSEQDRAFAALAARYLDEGLALSPVAATQIGDHRFDAELDDLGAAGRKASADWTRTMLAGLEAIDAAALSREHQVDARRLGSGPHRAAPTSRAFSASASVAAAAAWR